MTDELYDVEATLKQLGKTSRASFVMVVLGVAALIGSLIYSATRLAPLEEEIARKTKEIDELAVVESEYRDKIDAAKLEYKTLKNSIENLYAVKVTSTNRVYELKATAKLTDNVTSQGPGYHFKIFVNTNRETLNTIKEVKYNFDHPTFQHPKQSSESADDLFSVGYYGWGCLSKVGIQVELHSGEIYDFDFNMCKSLGPQWGTVPEKPVK